MAIALLLGFGPANALAAPQWLAAEPAAPSGGAPDVTADPDGNSAAAWTSSGHVYVAQRPRGGPWAPHEDLVPAGDASQDPKIVALPSGELVVLWVVGSEVLAAQKPPGGDWSAAQGISSTCCVALQDLVAGTDGTALGYWTSGDGPAETAVKPPGAASFEPAQDLPLNSQPAEVAVAPDGSAVAAVADFCDGLSVRNCVLTLYRPPDGDWGTPQRAGNAVSPVTGLGLAARSGVAPFTVAWGESNGTVRSADRATPAAGGGWSSPIDVPGTTPGRGGPILTPAGCASQNFGCVDLASRDDGLAVVWQQGSEVAASVRGGGGAWVGRESVGSANGGDADPEAAIAAGGAALAGWMAGAGSTGAVVRGAHRGPEGTWASEDLGSASVGEASLDLGDVAADGEGNGIAGFSDVDGSRMAGFDGAGPRFSAFSLPSPRQDEPAPFSAAADDNWSSLAGISWVFGDGGSGDGAAVSHTYGAGGIYTATATATDTVGNTTARSGPVDVAPTPTPTPDPCGTTDKDKDGIKDACDTNDGSKPPVAFKTVNATVVSGDVFVKLPAGAARAAQAKPPKGFVRLQGAETIPVGSTLDTAKGRVRLRTASDTRKHVQTADFFRGRFVVRQVRKPRGKAKKRSNKLITELRLTGSSFSKACRAGKASIAAKRSKKRVRRLFGDGKGSFRTRGRNAAATVRGTRWGVQDRCDGTLVAVQRGRVEVRDLVKHKTVFVRAGHTYLAKRR